jgi:hypothetical protein
MVELWFSEFTAPRERMGRSYGRCRVSFARFGVSEMSRSATIAYLEYLLFKS